MDQPETEVKHPPRNRLIIGGIVFISGFLSPLLIPFVIASGFSPGLKTTLTGLLALGIPELFMVIAVAILGKPGFAYLKQNLAAWFRRYGPPRRVSRGRFRIGLILFILPLFLGWGLPYFGDHIPFYEPNKLWLSITGDLLFISSFFVLGGDFWDKIRSLFIHEATEIPDNNK